MLRTFLNAFRVPEIRKKLAFTAAMLALYRLGAYIPAPGINVDAVKDIANNFTGSSVLGLLNVFSGGSLQRFAIFALGIMPYITASIMLQLLTVVVPQLDKLRKEGEVGQQKITQYTRYLTVALAFGQSIGYVFLFRTFSSAGTTVCMSWTMIEAVMYGMIPSANSERFASAPPAKMLRTLRIVPLAPSPKNVRSELVLTPGTGSQEPHR